MSEYIITDVQLKTTVECEPADVILPFTGVYVSGEKLPEIVRCLDCKYADWFGAVGFGIFRCMKHRWLSEDVDGFCKWGERKANEEHERQLS